MSVYFKEKMNDFTSKISRIIGHFISYYMLFLFMLYVIWFRIIRFFFNFLLYVDFNNIRYLISLDMHTFELMLVR